MRACPRCRAVYSPHVERCPSDGEPVHDGLEDPLVGQTLDRFPIVSALGQGAMGCVYGAEHVVLPREYAVKVLYRDLAANEKLVERFRREAQAVSAMEHENIVSVVDFVTLPGGLAFIVMELLTGRTLERAITAEAPFPPSRAAAIARQVAAGLGEAHRNGFVHRDVKPSNIMLSGAPGAEEVKVLDFGVVGMEPSSSTTRLTAIGHIVGTPAYMAPEQVCDPGVGPAADLYALGVILFEMLAGQPPFTGIDRTQVFAKHISEPPPPLPPSGGLEHLVEWLLEKKPSRRPRTADELIQAIARLELEPERAPGRGPRSSPRAELEEPTLRPDVEAGEDTAPRVAAFELADGDTFRPDAGLVLARAESEVDTDEALRRSQVSAAFEVTVPRMDRARILPRGARAGEDPFTSLGSAASDVEWPAWDPDGSFSALRAAPAAPPSQPDDAPLRAARARRASDPALEEPELPRRSPGAGSTARADDGPTQVDFDATPFTAEAEPPLAIPVEDADLEATAETRRTDPEQTRPEAAVGALQEFSTTVDLDTPSVLASDPGAPLVRGPGRRPSPGAASVADPATAPSAPTAHPVHAALKALDLPTLGGVHRSADPVFGAQHGATVPDFAPLPSRTEPLSEPSSTAPSVRPPVSKTLPLVREGPVAARSSGLLRRRAALVGLLVGLVLAAAALTTRWLLEGRRGAVVRAHADP